MRKKAIEKTCSRCKKSKPLSRENFYRDSTRTSGFYPWCIDCTKKINNERSEDPQRREVAKLRASEWYENNRRRSANRSYIKLYGISLAEVRRMKKKQNHRCAICGKFRRLCVDHCHKT